MPVVKISVFEPEDETTEDNTGIKDQEENRIYFEIGSEKLFLIVE